MPNVMKQGDRKKCCNTQNMFL